MRRYLALFAATLAVATAAETEKIRNERAVVFEDKLAAGESQTLRGEFPSVLVFTEAGTISKGAAISPVHAGDVQYAPPGPFTIRNAGKESLRIVRVEFPGKGIAETWGSTGIPHYKVILENPFARVYEIKVRAGTTEPMHTHRDRVVVCLSGATIVHTTPEGHKEQASLTTGEIDWRKGATHEGHNTDSSDLWVIAVEPKS